VISPHYHRRLRSDRRRPDRDYPIVAPTIADEAKGVLLPTRDQWRSGPLLTSLRAKMHVRSTGAPNQLFGRRPRDLCTLAHAQLGYPATGGSLVLRCDPQPRWHHR
jgi:hypothetical protein